MAEDVAELETRPAESKQNEKPAGPDARERRSISTEGWKGE